MRRTLSLLAVCTLLAVPMLAQNTDIESLSGLQFNFGNPGARSLGMGGAFLGLADDASAAEANPAGLTILRKPEVSIEGRNYLEQQLLTTSGTYPNTTRTAFTHYSNRAEITFGSVVVPFKNFAIAAYYHEPLRNIGSGQVVPIRNEFTGKITTNVPDFYLPKGGGDPISQAQCLALRNQTGDLFACQQFVVKPFLTAVDVQQRTYGVAGAWQIGKLSLGGAARYQTFREEAFTYRVTSTFDFDSILVQTTGKVNGDAIEPKNVHDLTFSGGFKYALNDKWSFGGVYKQGAKFVAPLYGANSATKFNFVNAADTTFHVPDIAGLGASFRPIPVLTVNVDAVRVKYSNLVDDFVTTVGDFQSAGIDTPYSAKDIVELHVGAEYFFSTKVPFALRAGYWRDPAHSIEYSGPLGLPGGEGVAAALLYPKGQTQNHVSVGGGFAWPRFQLDFAYDSTEHYKVGSISAVTRF
jgi:long-subunit fatty acid transport protein